MNCQVCGQPSGHYPICLRCNKLKSEGKVVKCEKCGKWHNSSNQCSCDASTIKQETPKIATEKSSAKYDNCIVCGVVTTNGNPLCLNCFKEKEKIKIELGKHKSPQDIKDHYYNQKRMLFKVKNPDYTITGKIRLIVLAEELYLYYSDTFLKQRVFEDVVSVKKVVSEKANNAENKSSKKNFDDEDFRKQFPAEHQCDDGHYVRSYSEMLIDNWLYHHNIVHAYEKSVFMESDPDAVVLSDFYLPQGSVYVEFWGLNDDEKYLDRKKKKLDLYTKNEISLIEMEEKDVKRLNDVMPRKLHSYLKDVKFD